MFKSHVLKPYRTDNKIKLTFLMVVHVVWEIMNEFKTIVLVDSVLYN